MRAAKSCEPVVMAYCRIKAMRRQDDERIAGACSRMDERRARMKRILRYHSFSNLLPGRETKDKETIAEDPIFKMNHNKAA